MIFFTTLTLVETELAIQGDLFLLVVAWETWDVCLLDLSHFCESCFIFALSAFVLTIAFLILSAGM